MMNPLPMPFLPLGCGACLMCGSFVPPTWMFCSPHCQDLAQTQQGSPVHVDFRAADANHANPAPPRGGEVDYSLACQCCQVKTVSGGSCCSKRCSWFTQCRCPQCGRDRGASFIYCSGSCAAQASQANWCSECGVRQMAPGQPSCGYANCVAAAQASQQWGAGRSRAVRGSSKKITLQTRHELLPAEDKVRQSIAAQVAAAMGPSVTVLNVVKVAVDANRRKAFLAYRSQVERTMSQRKAVKYGHGGEGNEQRRYFPFNLQCTLGTVAAGCNGPHELGTCTHAAARDEATHTGCDTCTLLQQSFSLQAMQRGSHYSTSSISTALPWCHPNHAGIKALVVARVVVGVADVMHVEYDESPKISIPEDPNSVHSVVVTDGNIANDGTYVFRDDAVDPLFVVLLR